jgi:hypothetical protein
LQKLEVSDMRENEQKTGAITKTLENEPKVGALTEQDAIESHLHLFFFHHMHKLYTYTHKYRKKRVSICNLFFHYSFPASAKTW